VLLVGGDGEPDLAPDAVVTARVVGHVLGDKVRIGKYRPKKGYKRHTGFRAALSEIEIQSIGSRSASTGAKKADETPKAETASPAEAKKAPARKPAAKKPTEKK
jgi:large subunit ribosomal protein L21